MAPRTFVIGDIHGDLDAFERLLAMLPPLTLDDTIVLLGDYVDRGPKSREVVARVRGLAEALGCWVVPLRGNHEDAWLRVIDTGWEAFLIPAQNGCLATLCSFTGQPPPEAGQFPTPAQFAGMMRGGFLPRDVVAWMRELRCWYEDEHAIYVHAGLAEQGGRWAHPKDVSDPTPMLWTRTAKFFRSYDGKRVVVGHTRTDTLPPELSHHTPEDPTDLWAGACVTAIDTGAGWPDGFLTALELPALHIYESRVSPAPAKP